MAVVHVITDDTNQMCCGERREVGDVVTIEIHNYEGTLYEERHGIDGILTQPITGTVAGIEWRPAVMQLEGGNGMILKGYGLGSPVDSTDYRDPDVDHWAFDFTAETDEPIPAPSPGRSLSDAELLDQDPRI